MLLAWFCSVSELNLHASLSYHCRSSLSLKTDTMLSQGVAPWEKQEYIWMHSSMYRWFFDPTNEASSVLFLTGHSQEPFTMEGTWAALFRLSPSPVGLKSSGLCQNIFMLPRAEKISYILLFS